MSASDDVGVHRYHVAKELVETERAFVENLKRLIEVYQTPLNQLAFSPLVRRSSSAISASFNSSSPKHDYVCGKLKGSKTPQYVTPKRRPRPVLTKKEIEDIFCNVEQIYLLNAEFLASLRGDFEKVPQGKGLQVKIGRTFQQFAHFFRMYATFCNAHENAQMLIGELASTRPAFEAFLSKVRVYILHSYCHSCSVQYLMRQNV